MRAPDVASGVLTFCGSSDPRWFAALHHIVTTCVMVPGTMFAAIVSQAASHRSSLAFPPSSRVLFFRLAG